MIEWEAWHRSRKEVLLHGWRVYSGIVFGNEDIL